MRGSPLQHSIIRRARAARAPCHGARVVRERVPQYVASQRRGEHSTALICSVGWSVAQRCGRIDRPLPQRLANR
eukprot:11162643-Lingulodinium_polyedra.AAC.1